MGVVGPFLFVATASDGLSGATAVQSVDGLFYGGYVIPVNFGVAIAKRLCVPDRSWGVEITACILVERRQRTIFVQVISSPNSSSPRGGHSLSHVTIRVDGLPNGKQTVYVCVV